MSRLIPQYNMPAVDVGGGLAGVLQTSKDMGSGLGTIASTLQKHTATNEQLRAKAVEEQRLADVLALQQQQAEQSNLHNKAILDQRERQMLQREKQFDTMMANDQAQQATHQFTNNAMVDILSQPTIKGQQDKLAHYRQMGGFNPDVRTVLALNESWQPKPQEYKSTSMSRVNKDGTTTTVYTRSPEEEKRFLEMGYSYGKLSGGNGGSDSKSKTAEKEMGAYNKLYETVGDFGWYDKSEARENLKMIQGMGIPSVLAERALIEAKDKELWEGRRFDLNTIDKAFGDFTTKDGETVRLGTYIKRAKDQGAVVTYDQATGKLQMVKPAIQIPRDAGTLKEIINSPQGSLRSRGREWMGPSLGGISDEDIIDPSIFGGM